MDTTTSRRLHALRMMFGYLTEALLSRIVRFEAGSFDGRRARCYSVFKPVRNRRTPSNVIAVNGRVGVVAGILAFALAALPMLGALHQAQHLTEEIVDEDSTSSQVASAADGSHGAVASCELCKATARTKHSCRPDVQLVAFLRGDGAVVAAHDLDAMTRIERALPSARAPPLA